MLYVEEFLVCRLFSKCTCVMTKCIQRLRANFLGIPCVNITRITSKDFPSKLVKEIYTNERRGIVKVINIFDRSLRNCIAVGLSDPSMYESFERNVKMCCGLEMDCRFNDADSLPEARGNRFVATIYGSPNQCMCFPSLPPRLLIVLWAVGIDSEVCDFSYSYAVD